MSAGAADGCRRNEVTVAAPAWAVPAGAAAVAFLATSMDELLVYVALFARAAAPRASLSAADVAAGSALGFAGVLALSAVGVAGAALPTAYVKLLGFLPILLGLRKLARRLWRWRASAMAAKAAMAVNEGTEAGADTQTEALIVPAAVGDAPELAAVASTSILSGLAIRCLRPGVAETAAVALTGGSEEVSVFLPLFATHSHEPTSVAAIVLTLAAMLLVWLTLAAALIQLPPVARAIEAFGDAAEPWLLIAVGLYCIVGSVAFPV